MTYLTYNKKVEKVSKIIQINKKLITTSRKGHNHRDLQFKINQKKINTAQFDSILAIEDNYIDCEASVSVGQINRKTIPKKKMVPSLPEGDNFTVGGCLGGLALGSNSYIHGFFNNNVIDFDVVLGNGNIIKNVSKNNHSDLYYGIGGTYGTMGIITRVKMKLIECESYVKITYNHYKSFQQFYEAFSSKIKGKKDDFIEAFVNSKSDFTIVSANFVEDVKKEEILIIKDKSILKQRHMCIYAQIANKKDYSYLRLVDYLERYSYSAFWGHYLYTPYKLRDYLYAGLVYSLIPRKMIQGDKLNVGKYFLAANQIVGDYARDEHVLTTDIGVPLSNLEKALELVDEMTETYPLWICPSKDNYHPDKIFCTRKKELCDDNMILDIGIYGIKNTNIDSKIINQTFEKFSFANGVFKGFFSTCYFNYDQFWEHFDKERYEQLRIKYHANEKFMDIYEKITYRNDSKKIANNTLRSKLFTFFGKGYLKQINKNKKKLIK
tara:strand:+ start:1628 stop:3109 length:1482 start_codon:yes stop_codon:yes gene_type:complete